MASLEQDRGHWVIRYFNEHGRRTKVRTKFKANKNGKAAAERLAHSIQEDVERRKHGLVDTTLEAIKVPLDDYLADFKQALTAREPSKDYGERLLRRLTWMLRGIGARSIPDLKAQPTVELLNELRSRGMPDRCLSQQELVKEAEFEKARRLKKKSAKTRDDYLEALQQFCRWLETRTPGWTNPLGDIKPLVSRQRHKKTATFERRAMTPEEFAKLLDAAARRGAECKQAANPNTPKHVLEDIRFRGETRSMAYLLAGTIGVRITAMGALRWEDLNLAKGAVRLRAEHAKNRREATPELPDWLLAKLKEWKQRVARHLEKVVSPTDRIFALLPVAKNLKRLLDQDLAFAGIERVNGDGRIDCHALRTFAATRLYEAGIDSSIAAETLGCSEAVMARHYRKISAERRREAINQLPAPKSLPKLG